MNPMNPFRNFLLLIGSIALTLSSANAQNTYIWADSNVTGATPPASLNWFNATQGTWTGGTPVSSNLNTIQFFTNATTSLPNTVTHTQNSVIDNGGIAFQLGTLTLTGRASNTNTITLTETISGDALNFSAATGTINLNAVNQNNNRRIIYNVNSAIQLGTVASGSVLTLTGNGTSAFNIGGLISELQLGGGSLIKSGTATVTLTNASNSYSGGTSINGGRVQISSDGNLGAATGDISFGGSTYSQLVTTTAGLALGAGRTITLNTGATAAIGASNQNGAINFTINGQITGAGTLQVGRYQLGSGTTFLASTGNDFTGSLILGNFSTFTAQGWTYSNFVVDVASLEDTGSLGSGNIIFGTSRGTAGDNATFQWSANAVSGLTLNNRRIQISDTATANTIAVVANNNGSAARTVVINTDLSVTSTSAKTFRLSGTNLGNNEFNGVIGNGSGSIQLSKTGTGRWDLGVGNTYAGTTTVTGGVLVLNHLTALPGGIGTAGGTNNLNLNGGVLGLGNGDFSRGLGTGATQVQVTANNAGWATYGADRNVNLGGAAASVDWATAGTGFGGFTLGLSHATATHKVTLQNDLNLGNATRTVNVADGAAAVDAELSGAIIGTTADTTVALDKTGTGVLSLSNANTYTGITRISGGTLVADNATAIPGGLATTGGTSGITFNGGVLGLGTGNFTRSLAAAGTITGANFTGAGGWAAFGADRNVNLGGAGATITWTTANTGFNSQTLILGSSGATHTVSLLNPIALGSGTRTVRVDKGAAAVDGIMSGVLSGTAALTVGGSGTLSLTNSNSFNGVVTIGNNTASTLKLQVNSIKDVNGGSSALGAPTTAANGLIQIGATSNHSTLEFINLAADQSSNRQIRIGSSATGSGGAFILNNDADNTVTFSNTAFNVAATGTTTFNRVLRLGGSNTGDNTISGAIINNVGTSGGLVSVTKQDSGKWILTGTSSYTGATNVDAGNLIVNGSISTSVLTTVASGATIGGSGTVGALTVQSGGFINPGNSPGILNTGDYTQAGLYTAEIEGLVAGNSAGNHDQINVTDTVNIAGGSLTTLFSTFTPVLNDLIFILLNDGTDAITGTYTGLAQGAVVDTYDGFDWIISYNADSSLNTFTGSPNGNDIALMAVAIPEPNVAALLGALGGILLLRRRR